MNGKPMSDEEMKRIMTGHVVLPADARARIAAAIDGRLKLVRGNRPASAVALWLRRLYPVAAAAAAIAVCALLVLRIYGGRTGAGVVTEAWNDCKIIREGRNLPGVENGAEIMVGDIIVTGPRSGLHFRTGDGSLIFVAENSKLECTAPRGVKPCTLSLFRGGILAKVSHDPDSRFSVRTPDMLLKVLGTEFEVKVGGVPLCSQNNGKDGEMKNSALVKTAAYTALTVLSGAVAVSPLNAEETTVKSGSSAQVSASGGVTVSPVKAGEFIAAMIASNYRKDDHVWLAESPEDRVLTSIYRFDPVTGKNEKTVDVVGYAYSYGNQFGNGALFSSSGVLIGNLDAIGGGAGNPMVNSQVMAVAANGEILSLENIAQYRPLYPVLSPDGSKLAFIGNEPGSNTGGLYVMDIGTSKVRMVYQGGLRTIPAWSPDSSEILVSKAEGYTVRHRLVVIDVESATAVDTAYEGCGAVFSADGGYIAYSGDFREDGSWMQGVPTSGNMLVARYPGGEAASFGGDGEGGAIMPAFSADGTRLAYLWKNADGGELHIVDLDTKQDRKICRIPDSAAPRWLDAEKLIFTGLDNDGNPLVGLVDITANPAGFERLKPEYSGAAEAEAARAALKPALELYLAGLKSCCNNQLPEAMRNYRSAYEKLLEFKGEVGGIDPAFKLESLSPYLEKFGKYAGMDEKALYMEQLDGRMLRMPFLLNNYARKHKRLPESMEAFATYIASNVSCNYIDRGTPEAMIQFLMPDQKPGSASAFTMKIIDEKTVEFHSAPTPSGERYMVRAVLDGNQWRAEGDMTVVR